MKNFTPSMRHGGILSGERHTRHEKSTSRNELSVSETREREYQLYRLFSFGEQPKLFVLAGSLRNTCRLEPVTFSALPK